MNEKKAEEKNKKEEPSKAPKIDHQKWQKAPKRHQKLPKSVQTCVAT